MDEPSTRGKPPRSRRWIGDWLDGWRQRFWLKTERRQARLGLEEIPRASEEGAARLAAGRRLVKAGDLPGAERACRSALELDLGNGDAHLLLAELLAARGELDSARSTFDHGVRLGRDPLAALERAAAAMMRSRAPAYAIPFLERHLSLVPGDSRVRGLLAEARALAQAAQSSP